MLVGVTVGVDVFVGVGEGQTFEAVQAGQSSYTVDIVAIGVPGVRGPIAVIT